MSLRVGAADSNFPEDYGYNEWRDGVMGESSEVVNREDDAGVDGEAERRRRQPQGDGNTRETGTMSMGQWLHGEGLGCGDDKHESAR